MPWPETHQIPLTFRTEKCQHENTECKIRSIQTYPGICIIVAPCHHIPMHSSACATSSFLGHIIQAGFLRKRRWNRKQGRLFRTQGRLDLVLGCGGVLFNGLFYICRVLFPFLPLGLSVFDEEVGPVLCAVVVLRVHWEIPKDGEESTHILCRGRREVGGEWTYAKLSVLTDYRTTCGSLESVCLCGRLEKRTVRR
ncbi:hypothetical protein F5144DRAFT_303441 [Chaetomium tenue]|uniref:Uncharacterized protein n=1 Tax=Chaetomium tenue TaxID=1854479 RepID=A0ACB7P2Z1_9PEZI|nr:hypothetical protein F5144DRAFT_303441 [Chaetomium globosum]